MIHRTKVGQSLPHHSLSHKFWLQNFVQLKAVNFPERYWTKLGCQQLNILAVRLPKCSYSFQRIQKFSSSFPLQSTSEPQIFVSKHPRLFVIYRVSCDFFSVASLHVPLQLMVFCWCWFWRKLLFRWPLFCVTTGRVHNERVRTRFCN